MLVRFHKAGLALTGRLFLILLFLVFVIHVVIFVVIVVAVEGVVVFKCDADHVHRVRAAIGYAAQR